MIEFFPAYRPKGILDALMDEPRRDRRKLLLALFECYGEAGREPLLERMVLHEGGTIPDEHGWHKRNLIFLLRRLPQSDEAATQEVLRHLRGALASGETVMVVKEAIGALGQFRHRDAESALMCYLRSLVADLAWRATPATEASWDLLDRTCAALARQGTPDG